MRWLARLIERLFGRRPTPTKPPVVTPVPPPVVTPGPTHPPVIPVPGSGRMIRVTDDRDGTIAPRMMSDRANAIIEGDTALVFCGTDAGPRFFRVNLQTEQVERLGNPVGYGGETEGWHWLGGRVVLPVGQTLVSIDPRNGDQHAVLDIFDMPGHDLWQPHSSDDGRTFSATVRQVVPVGKYPYVGTIIQGPYGRRYEAAVGTLDESQVTRDGSHVVIKQNGEDNRIINLATGDVWDLADADGAIGHSDCGHGFIVGESNLPGPGRCVKLDLHTRERTDLFFTDNMGYVSVRAGICLWSNDTHLSVVSLAGAGVVTLLAHGATGTGDYDNRPKANLDPTARIATFMSNVHGRRDVYLAVL